MTQCVHFSSKRVLDDFFLIFSCFLSKQTVFLKNATLLRVSKNNEINSHWRATVPPLRRRTCCTRRTCCYLDPDTP